MFTFAIEFYTKSVFVVPTESLYIECLRDLFLDAIFIFNNDNNTLRCLLTNDLLTKNTILLLIIVNFNYFFPDL